MGEIIGMEGSALAGLGLDLGKTPAQRASFRTQGSLVRENHAATALKQRAAARRAVAHQEERVAAP
ncbi:hypothetical protein [Brevundimonas aurifodinae]|uniref:Uncharacterized protein n=1 Tax=Brevundimonas aurifodinae TaxID=1508312 RepID=A0ABV1NLQ5_9CAUL